MESNYNLSRQYFELFAFSIDDDCAIIDEPGSSSGSEAVIEDELPQDLVDDCSLHAQSNSDCDRFNHGHSSTVGWW